MNLGVVGSGLGFLAISVHNIVSQRPQSLIEEESRPRWWYGMVAHTLVVCHRFGLLPSSWTAQLLLHCQNRLRDHVDQLFERFPPTGVYHQNLDQFQIFCERVTQVFLNSPRNQVLSSIEQKIRETYPTDSSLRELLSLLKCGTCSCQVSTPEKDHPASCQPPFVHFFDVIKRKQALRPGKIHDGWSALMMCKTPEEECTMARLAEIRQGILGKALKKNQTVSEEELRQRLEDIVAEKRRKFQEKMERAAQLYQQLATNPQYQFYQRVDSLWESTGCEQAAREYQQVDQQVGHERVDRGSAFEEQSELVFHMVTRLLPSEVKKEYHRFHYLTSALWIHHDKPVGEIDLVILARHRTTRASHVVAIVEMKSNFYNLASAWCRQHTTKLNNLDSHSIRASDGTLLQVARFIPIAYIATLIPHHYYRLGAEKDILDGLIDFIPRRWESMDERREEMGRLMLTLQEQHHLTQSPREVLREHADRIIVLV